MQDLEKKLKELAEEVGMEVRDIEVDADGDVQFELWWPWITLAEDEPSLPPEMIVKGYENELCFFIVGYKLGRDC